MVSRCAVARPSRSPRGRRPARRCRSQQHSESSARAAARHRRKRAAPLPEGLGLTTATPRRSLPRALPVSRRLCSTLWRRPDRARKGADESPSPHRGAPAGTASRRCGSRPEAPAVLHALSTHPRQASQAVVAGRWDSRTPKPADSSSASNTDQRRHSLTRRCAAADGASAATLATATSATNIDHPPRALDAGVPPRGDLDTGSPKGPVGGFPRPWTRPRHRGLRARQPVLYA